MPLRFKMASCCPAAARTPHGTAARSTASKAPLLALALSGAFAITVELVSSDWAAFRLAEDLGTSAGFAGLGGLHGYHCGLGLIFGGDGRGLIQSNHQEVRPERPDRVEPRVIHISRFDLTKYALPELSFLVGTSKGAYVRTIAHDLGEKFGCGGHLNELRRTAIGQFRIENAAKIEELEVMSPSTLRKRLIPVIQAVPTHAL